jgi:hypothetical protein
MKRQTKAEKQADKQIEQAFYRVANGAQINVMDLGKVFSAGRAAIAEGKDLDAAIRAIVAVLRQN